MLVHLHGDVDRVKCYPAGGSFSTLGLLVKEAHELGSAAGGIPAADNGRLKQRTTIQPNRLRTTSTAGTAAGCTGVTTTAATRASGTTTAAAA